MTCAKYFQINTIEIQVNTPKKETIPLTEYTTLNNKRQTTVGKMQTMNCDGLNYSDTLQVDLFN